MILEFLNIKTGTLPIFQILVTLAIALIIFKLLSSKKKKGWVRVGEVSKLIIHPVKSFKGIEFNDAIVTSTGLKASNSPLLRDRVFMVVDEDGKFLSSEKYPKMTRIFSRIEVENLILNFEGESEISIPIPSHEKSSKRSCRVLSEKIENVLDCGDEVADWIEDVLQAPRVRLLYHSNEKTQRGNTMSPVQKRLNVLPTDKGLFHFDTSYMIMTEESMSALNNELDEKMTYESFRPSILLKGTKEAFCEESWSLIKIGESEKSPVLKYALPCLRCPQVNINEEIGVMSPIGEPLKTLYKIKPRVHNNEVINKVSKNKPVMGVNMGLVFTPMTENVEYLIKVGDPVFALI